MSNGLRIFLLAALCLPACGCGGGSAPATDKKDAASNAAAAPAAAPPAAKPAAPAVETVAPSSLSDLLIYFPVGLKSAVGAHITALASPSNPWGPELLNQIQPVTAVLTKAGLPIDQIEFLWAGSNPGGENLLICARTKSKLASDEITKKMNAGALLEKVGKAEVFKLAEHPPFQNCVAFIDSRTILIGRQETVIAALKNPAPGPVRLGLETLNLPQAEFWVAGEDFDIQRRFHGISLALSRNEEISGGLSKPRAFAIGLNMTGGGSGKAGGSQSAATTPASAPGTAASSAGTVPQGSAIVTVGLNYDSESLASVMESKLSGALKAVKLGLSAILQPEGSSGASQPGNMPMPPGAQAPADGQPPAAQPPAAPPAAAPPGTPPPGTPPPGTPPPGTPPPGTPPPGTPPPGTPPPGTAPPGTPPPGTSPPGTPPPGTPPPGTPPPAGQPPPAQPPGTAPAGQTPPGTTSQPGKTRSAPADINSLHALIRVLAGIGVTRDKQKVTLSETFAGDLSAFVFMLVSDSSRAIGATPISDGIFDGTLTVLGSAMQQWQAAKPDAQKGVTRIRDLQIGAGNSWMIYLLPYVGQNDLYVQFDLSKSWADKVNLQLTGNVIPAFLNPMDPRTHWTGLSYAGQGLTHFVGMSGVEDRRNVVAAALSRSDPRAGIFGYDSIAKPSEITDGASQTIMIVGSGQTLVAPWVQGGGATIRGARAPYFDKLSGIGSVGAPKDGVFVMFADGSTRMIPSDIDPDVFKAMCTMHGAEKIDLTKTVTQSP